MQAVSTPLKAIAGADAVSSSHMAALALIKAHIARKTLITSEPIPMYFTKVFALKRAIMRAARQMVSTAIWIIPPWIKKFSIGNKVVVSVFVVMQK